MFSVALMSDCSAWVLPSTLPFGVRTFLSFPGFAGTSDHLIHSTLPCGNAEKSRQRRSRHFAVLTSSEDAPRAKRAAALLDELF